MFLAIPRRALAALAVLALGASAATAQARTVPDTARASYDPALRGLTWRLVGPFRGGRAVAVVGDPTRRQVFYFGAVDGGVWKTTNAGQSGRTSPTAESTIASVGAIAIAPSRSERRSAWAAARPTARGLDVRRRHVAVDRRRRDVDAPRPRRRAAHRAHRRASAQRRRGVRRGDGARERTERDARRLPHRPMAARTGARCCSRRVHRRDRPRDGPVESAHPLRGDVAHAAHAVGARRGRPQERHLEDDRRRRHVDASCPRTPASPRTRSAASACRVSPAMPRRVYATIECARRARAGSSGPTTAARRGSAPTATRMMVRPWYYSVVTADPSDTNTVYVMNLSVDARPTAAAPSRACACRTATRTSCGSIRATRTA